MRLPLLWTGLLRFPVCLTVRTATGGCESRHYGIDHSLITVLCHRATPAVTRGQLGRLRRPSTTQGSLRFAEADARTRTADPFITSEVLYQLSYVGAASQSSPGRPRGKSPGPADPPRKGFSEATPNAYG